MSGTFTLAIPGVVFSVHSPPGIDISEMHPLYREFIGNSSSPTESLHALVELAVDDPRIDTRWPVVFDSGDSWLALRDDGDMVFAFRSPTEPGAFWWTAQFTPGETNIRVTCDPEVIEKTPTRTRIANPIHYPLDQLLTMFLLAQRGGCIVHAAGVHRKGRGIACIGRSGAGKTTLMSLLEGRTDLERLSDDRLILRAGEPPLVSGTPWAGEGMVAANDTADLAALIFLHQGPAHALQPITPREAAAQLLPTTSIPWFDEAAMTGCLATLDRLIRDTPVFNLEFRLDSGVADLVDRLI
ncbi:MAG: hypothetical protein MUP13_10070 [Thermoanaerobaculales bacterium]|nr:hypothetical protein [Thermoanaerobaculales bacterium]